MKKFDFEKINLLPKLCVVKSRSECDTSITFGGNKFKLPVVPANMQSVIDEALALKLAQSGYFYILHRFDVDVIKFISDMKKLNLITSISIGVNEDSKQLILTLIKSNLVPDYITIDIAHGHSIKMKEMLIFLHSISWESNKKPYIIAGNVSTPEAVSDLINWGTDCIKVGIGPGSACTTWPATGFGSRNCQASTILECSSAIPWTSKKSITLMADGGIRTPSDITKSLVLGADMVMVGGMLSGFTDSPGDIVVTEQGVKKEFWGSASQFQSGKTNRIEGKKILIDFKNKSLLEELVHIEECLQSSISYGGGKTIDCLNQVKWI
jgi:GMP reductase